MNIEKIYTLLPTSRRDVSLGSKALIHLSLFSHPARDATNKVASLRDAKKGFGGLPCYRAMHPLRDATG